VDINFLVDFLLKAFFCTVEVGCGSWGMGVLEMTISDSSMVIS